MDVREIQRLLRAEQSLQELLAIARRLREAGEEIPPWLTHDLTDLLEKFLELYGDG